MVTSLLVPKQEYRPMVTLNCAQDILKSRQDECSRGSMRPHTDIKIDHPKKTAKHMEFSRAK